MNIYFKLIRSIFVLVSILTFSAFTTSTMTGGFTPTNLLFGMIGGGLFASLIIGIEILTQRFCLFAAAITLLGITIGVMFGQSLMLILTSVSELIAVEFTYEALQLISAAVFLLAIYLGITLTARIAKRGNSGPFNIEAKNDKSVKKDILIDGSVLTDSRIIDLASSGLLDNHLIVPRFILKDLFGMVESNEEALKNKGRRSLDVFKKLENITSLELRYSDIDYPEIKDQMSKLVKLARTLDANLMTVDLSRIQQSTIEGLRVINLNTLSNALKPLTQAGEYINIKIQRYGKEPRQGVGYLDDGTMVVVNGGAEYIGETIKAQVLSVKHTSSGRMIFCNSTDEGLLSEQESALNLASLDDSHPSTFFAR